MSGSKINPPMVVVVVVTLAQAAMMKLMNLRRLGGDREVEGRA